MLRKIKLIIGICLLVSVYTAAQNECTVRGWVRDLVYKTP